MRYKIEVNYCTNACEVIHFPPVFDFPGEDPIDACNYRIRKILEERENGIDKSNILSARVYDEKGIPVLEVDYREGDLHLDISKKINDFWINH